MFRLTLNLHGAEVKVLELESGREYVFGRASDCDVRLEEQPGLSRHHFRLYEENGQWQAQVLSKFGDIICAGQPVQTLSLENGSVFKLAGYDFRFTEVAAVEVAPEEASMQFASGQDSQGVSSGSLPDIYRPPAKTQQPPGRHLQAVPQPDFEGNDEATRIVQVSSGIPFIRVVQGSGEEETLKLEGKKWLAGRDEGCEILLDERKASRRQFELTSSPQGFFVRDLGSSNGTLLNGSALAADELKPIRSGDAIQVGAIVLYFEVRDPNFEKKLMVIPPEVMSSLPSTVSTPAPYEMINYPVAMGPGGAIRVDQGYHNGSMSPYEQQWNGAARDVNEIEKKKKLRFYIIVAIILLPLVYFLSSLENQPEKKPTKQPLVTNEAFAKLAPDKQQMVQATFVAGKNLFMQGKHSLAAEQLRKLHEVLPSGYENSIAIAEECRAQAEQEEILRLTKLQQEEAAKNRLIVEQNLRQCEGTANSTYDMNSLMACLAPTLEREPENPLIANYKSRVQNRVTERDLKTSNQRDYADRVSRGRSLFAKAEGLEQKGDIFSAIDAYKKHLGSPYPDPDGLKARSQRNMLAISKNVSGQVDRAVQAAEAAFASQNYKEAISQIKKAKELDPYNHRAAELNAKVRRELTMKLREIYEESVINEGLGQVEQAKGNWKKIIDLDHHEGDYYKRAKNKLRQYGGA